MVRGYSTRSTVQPPAVICFLDVDWDRYFLPTVIASKILVAIGISTLFGVVSAGFANTFPVLRRAAQRKAINDFDCLPIDCRNAREFEGRSSVSWSSVRRASRFQLSEIGRRRILDSPTEPTAATPSPRRAARSKLSVQNPHTQTLKIMLEINCPMI